MIIISSKSHLTVFSLCLRPRIFSAAAGFERGGVHVNRLSYALLVFVMSALFLNGCAGASVQDAGRGESIKVLVLSGVKELSISGKNDTLRIKWDGSGSVLVNGSQTSLPAVYRPSDEFINLNGRPYRGVLTVEAGKDYLIVVNELPLEAYIAGIINNEVSSKWPKSAVMAQAVVARTYAVHQKKLRADAVYHIEGTTMGQVYSGASSEDAAAASAVSATEGQILTFNGEPALTVYHSNAGGMTEDSALVWSSSYPYLISVESPYDKSAPKYTWEYTLTAAAFKTALNKAGYRLDEPVSVVTSLSPSGRAKTVVIKDTQGGSAAMSGEDLRKTLGYGNLKSTIFKAQQSADVFVFTGRGSGHGVGLSQWGAKGMADAGYSYKEILRHYYPGAELVKVD